MKKSLSLAQIRIIYICIILFLIALSFYVYVQVNNLIASSNWVNHTTQVSLSLQRVSGFLTEAETNQRGFILTGDTLLLQNRDASFGRLSRELPFLDSLISDNLVQVQNKNRLHEAIDEKLASMKKVLLYYKPLPLSGEFESDIREGVVKMDSVKAQIDRMSATEIQLLKWRTQKYERLSFITPFFIMFLFMGSLCILLLSYFRVNRALEESQQLYQSFEKEKSLAEAILNSSVDHVVVYDTDTRFLYFSKSCETAYHKTREEVLGKKLSEVFPQVSGTKSYNDLLKAIGGETIHNETYYSPFWDRYYENFITPLRTPDQKIYGVLAVAHDDTKNIVSARKLEEMNKELQSFAYITSHDLQEPLRKIQTFANRILEKEKDHLSEQGQVHFRRIQESAQRMQVLIEDLLTYSRTSTSERKFVQSDLGKIIEDVKEDLNEDLQQKQAVVEMSDLCSANVIPFQFRQLIYNLMSNSIKFSSPERPLRISIKCEIISGAQKVHDKIASEMNYCHLRISDNGIGFDKQYTKKIFEVFQRLHGKAYSGTGIGLAIVYKIVENHKGLIEATGEPGKGASFDIYIPAS